MLVNTAVNQYLQFLDVEKGLSANTIYAYQHDLELYINFLQEQQIADIKNFTSDLVNDFLVSLYSPKESANGTDSEKAISSIARVIVTVRGFHKFLAIEEITPIDYAAEIKPPSVGLHLPKALTLEQIEAMIFAAGMNNSSEPLPLRDKFLLELLYSTGARISELISLNINDIDFAEAIVKLTGKGDKQRIVPVGRVALAYAKEYLENSRPKLMKKPESALFINTRGNSLSRFSAWHIMKAAADRANISEEVSPHSFRHSYATHLLQAGADIRVVQELLGHSSVTTTQVYTKVTLNTLREVYKHSHPRA